MDYGTGADEKNFKVAFRRITAHKFSRIKIDKIGEILWLHAGHLCLNMSQALGNSQP